MSIPGEWILLEELLHCLLECSEKAASIARIFRDQDDLFGLLVEQKSEIKKNRLLVQDFKTLADVLVQETIKRDVGRKFPLLSSKILGEEQNTFRNTLGESITVELTDSLEETVNLLCKVLPSKVQIAEALAATVHSNDIVCCKQFSSSVTIPADRLGIWIDPIDSTAEYIQAKQSNSSDEYGMELYGLKCVCVLIGVYDLETGLPLIGIINQPFYKQTRDPPSWESNIYWGINYNSVTETSPSTKNKSQERKIVVTSSFENKHLQSILQSKYTVIHAAGAGYKCLVVAKMTVDLYVLSLPNTHFWDTCGPHAILASQGGGIVNFKQIINTTEKLLDHSNIQNYQLKYLEDSTNPTFQNTGGLIAYRNLNDLLEFLELLREKGYQYNE